MVKTMKPVAEAVRARSHSGAVREVSIDLSQFLHAQLEGAKLTLAVPVHDGPVFESAYCEYLEERYGKDFADRVLEEAHTKLFRHEVVERMSEKVK